MVIHGGVDDFTRIPVFLHSTANNKAATVLELFLNAVVNYGLPSRVRSDKGKENVDMAWYTWNHPLRGPGRGIMICGRSVHNHRIVFFALCIRSQNQQTLEHLEGRLG